MVPNTAIQRGPEGPVRLGRRLTNNTADAEADRGRPFGRRRHHRHVGHRRRRARRHRRPVQAAEPTRRSAFRHCSRRRTTTAHHEHLRTVHPPADRHLAADGGDRLRRHRRLSVAAGRAAAAGRLPDHPGLGAPGRAPAPRPWRSSVAAPLERQFAPDSRRHADDLAQRARRHARSSSSSTSTATSTPPRRTCRRRSPRPARQLPQSMTAPPSYKKVNPADSPIMILALRSDTLPLTKVDDYADLFLAQQISQVPGVAQVSIFGEQHARDPHPGRSRQARRSGLTLEDIRRRSSIATTNAAKGTLNTPTTSFTIATNDQIIEAEPYNDVILAYRNGAPIRVRDVGQAVAGAGRPQRRRLSRTTRTASSWRSSSSPAPTSSRRSTRSRRSCRSSPRASRRPSRSRPSSTAPRPSAPRSPTWSSRWRSPSRWSCW